VGSELPTGAVSSAQLELRLAGTFGVIRDGRELALEAVGSRKARTLLKLLAVERPGLVPVDRIIDALWAGQPPALAEQNVATLVSRLRSVLGAGVIEGGRAGYRLAAGPAVSVDLDVAARLCEQAERKLPTAAALALTAAERAAGLLAAGTALDDDPYAGWADPARAELRELSRRARLLAGQAALAAGEAAAAARHAGAAAAADPLDEAAHRLFMSAAAAAGEPARALAAYAALRQRLSDELGTDPAPLTRDVHLAILREQPAGAGQSGGGGLAAPGGTAAGRPDRRAGPVGHAGDVALAGSPGAGRPAAGAGQALRRGTAAAGPAVAGRDAEMDRLRAAWLAAAAGRPALIMIVGEAGIGKTALAEALAGEASADGATLLRTRCYEAERSLFLQPVVDAVTPVVSRMPAARLAGLLGEHAQAAAALLPGVSALPDAAGPGRQAAVMWRGSAELERRRALEAMTALLTGLAAANPVLLVVDDLQYAGQSTVELLHYLARHAAAARLLILVTVRPEDAGTAAAALDDVAARLELGPLSAAAVRQLAGQAGQAELADGILARTKGHTLFVVEVLRSLAAGESGLPDTLRNAVLSRVRRAGQATETLLRAAAVLGAVLDPQVLAALLDRPVGGVLDACAGALDARLLTVSGRDYEFANDLIRAVLYESTPEPSRLAYHRRAADLLTEHPEALATHAAAVGDWQRAARAWLLAAEIAMRRYAAPDTIGLATEALAAAGQAGDAELRARALVLRGRALEATGSPAAAFADMKQGAAQARAAGDRRLEMLALRALGGDVAVSLRQPVSSYAASLLDGLRIAESLGDRASEADLLSRLAVIAGNRLHLDQALEQGLRAAAAGRAAADDQALAAGLDGLKAACLSAGDAAGLTEVLAELLPLLRRLGDPLLLQWAEFDAAFPAVAAADWAAAEAAMRQALRLNGQAGYPHFAAWYTAHLGWLARLRGQDEAAVALGRQALDLTGQHEHGWARAIACSVLGGTLLLTGQRAAATRLLADGLAAARDTGVEAYLLRCAAPLAAATGSPDLLAEADGLLASARVPAGCAWLPGYEAYLSLADAWLGQGEPARARAVLAPLLAVADRTPWTPVLAEALVADGRALIQAGQAGQARARLQRAAALATGHGMPHVLAAASSAQRQLG
jgi:DNA-binding SARP family transcriptional activator